MKRRQKFYLLLIIIPAVYLLLLLLLYIAESRAPDSQIHSAGSVLWFLVETISTVGYGDTMPVTQTGRVISAIFIIFSTGILVTAFGAAFSLFTSEALIMFRLRLNRHSTWYYFADNGMEAVTMAGNLAEEDPDGIIIFGEKPSMHDQSMSFPCYYIQTPLTRLVKIKHEKGKPIIVFFMKENDIDHNPRANNITELPVTVYAQTSNGRDQIAGNVHFFHSYECCARRYWRTKPLGLHEKQIVIIGFGNYGRNILERAILTNIIASDQQITYHIFGKYQTFLQKHDHLSQNFIIVQGSVTGAAPGFYRSPDKDILIFHDDPWENAHQLLSEADRIIITPDEEGRARGVYWDLQRYYHIKGRIDVRSTMQSLDISTFGSYPEIYNPQQIMKYNLDLSAVALNRLYMKSNPDRAVAWEDLDDFLRQSKIAAADHLIMKVRIVLQNDQIVHASGLNLQAAAIRYLKDSEDPAKLEEYRRVEHSRWYRFYSFHNWSYGPQNDPVQRTLPMLRPYEELSPEEAARHDHAWKLLKELEGN